MQTENKAMLCWIVQAYDFVSIRVTVVLTTNAEGPVREVL
jgi:hypothetical protein